MTGPKKPPTSPTALDAPPITLAPTEMSVLLAFRAMDGRRKQEALVRMERIAKTHPGRAAPVLRLVAGSIE